MKNVDIKDVDLDLFNYAKGMDEDDSMFYFRTNRDGEKLDIVSIVWGDLYDLVLAITQQEEAKEVIMMTAAYYISKGFDIEEYTKQIKEVGI